MSKMFDGYASDRRETLLFINLGTAGEKFRGCRRNHLGFNRARQNLVLEIQKLVFGAVFFITRVWKSHSSFAKFPDDISAFRKKYLASCATVLISYNIRHLRTPGVLFCRK